MKPLYTEQEFKKAKSEELLPCKCYVCEKTFYKLKRVINRTLEGKKGFLAKYCSYKCRSSVNITKQKVCCINCDKEFYKVPSQIKKSKNQFCSKSCSATYNNTHKTHGTRRSKLEIYFEERLTSLYPNLHIDYNKTEAINSELDIYIPSLKLAIELNGIFHYEPIYGQNKLNQIQNNDHRKFQACLEKNIELVLIDISSLSYFKPEKANKFLNIITEIINKKIY